MNCVEWRSTFLIRHISVTHSGRQFSWKSKLRLQIHWKLDLDLAPQFILFFNWKESLPDDGCHLDMNGNHTPRGRHWCIVPACYFHDVTWSVCLQWFLRLFNVHSTGSQAFDKNRNLKIGKDMSFQYRAGIYCNGKCLSRWSWTSRASWGRCCGGSGRRSRKIWSNSENFLD